MGEGESAMYKPVEITENTYWIGVNDHETDLFEAVWPLPKGVSYNAYMILGKKVALIDTVKRFFWSSYIDNIERILPEGKTLDYLIVNHMEPDHSGSIRALTNRYPEMVIVGNKKTMEFLSGFYGITDKVEVIQDGDGLKLGGHTLKFHLTPMVHWPETMMTFDETTGVLFAGDAFGGFGAHEGGIFDDEIKPAYYLEEIRRYFSNIVGQYSTMVQKAIAKLKDLDIRIIASAHGIIWRENPQKVVDLYDRWSRYEAEEGVVIVYGSMYTHTQKMAEAAARGLAEAGVKFIRLYDSARYHVSYIINDVWRFRGIILGSCTYNLGLFPPMAYVIHHLAEKSIKNRLLGLFGSYSWSGGAVKALKHFAEDTKWQLIEPVVEVKCAPTTDELEQCEELGHAMAMSLRNAV